jgi:hypothetical protein
VGEEPELYVAHLSDAPGATDYRERVEYARIQARQRYREYLAAVFDTHGFTDPGALADVVLDALTLWPDVESGEPC